MNFINDYLEDVEPFDDPLEFLDFTDEYKDEDPRIGWSER